MSFDIGETVNGIVDYLCNSTIMHYIISNPFINALLLVAIVVSIFLGFFYGSIKHESKVYFIKLYVYSFLIAAMILLLHYRSQEKDIEKAYGLESGARLYNEAIGGTDDKKSQLNEPVHSEQNYIGGNFIKVNTESCGCTKAAEGGSTEPKITQSIEQKMTLSTDKPSQINPVQTPSISIPPTKVPIQTGGMQTPPKTAGGVNVAKVAIVPSTKSPFSR